MDVEQAAAGKDLLEMVFFELVHAGATGDDDRPDVEIVERVGDTVEKHPVVGSDPQPLVGLAGSRLGIAAAQVARWQNRLRADVVEDRLGGQGDLREQTLRAATRKVEYRVAIVIRCADLDGVANDRHDLVVFDIEQNRYTLVEVVGGIVDPDANAMFDSGGPDQRFVREFNDGEWGGARIIGAAFDDDATLIFDELGSPIAEAGSTTPGLGGSVTVSGSGSVFTINVDAYTGRVTVSREDAEE